MTTDNLTWVAARASGVLGYLLVTISVAFGIALSLKVRSPTWPRYVTTEVHRRVTLLALAFTAVHGVTLLLDSFQAFTPLEVVLPGASHYRPLWVAFGIIAADLLLVFWLSERVQRRIGYGWWRRLHYLTFLAWILVTVHGLGSGSDSRAPWAVGLYGGGTLLVAGLVLLRIWPVATARQTAVMALAAAGIWVLGLWAVAGPLQPGWNAVANNGNGNGERVAGSVMEPAAKERGENAEEQQRGAVAVPSAAAGGLGLPSSFQATFSGRLSQTAQGDGTSAVTIDGSVSGGLSGTLRIEATQSSDGQLVNSRLALTTDRATCTGSLTEGERGRLGATCATADGQSIPLRLQLGTQRDGTVAGTISAGRQRR